MRRVQALTFRGVSIPVEIRGDGAKDLFFLPGLGVHPDNYAPGLDLLTSGFTVFTPDLSFRTHRALFDSVADYRECARLIAGRLAPEALWTGHSFGGLLALLGDRPAIALAPTVPVEAGWAGVVGRLLRLQLREYAGREGRRGVTWAWRIMLEYVATAIVRPGSLFPVASGLLHGGGEPVAPTAPRARILLARDDVLYRRAESERYLADAPGTYGVEILPLGHDWPVTEPAVLAETIRTAARDLSTAGSSP